MIDPLDMFRDLPDYPGNTKPRNRTAPANKPVANDYLNGAKSKVYRMGGVDREFFTVGELARALNRKPVTVRMWEQRGWIPKVKYRTAPPAGTQLPGKPTKGRRLYTKNQVECLVEAVERFRLDDHKAPNWVGFREFIRTNWPSD